MFNVKEAEIVTIPFLKLIEGAGKEYALNGAISEGLMQKIAIPMIPEEEYIRIANSQNK